MYDDEHTLVTACQSGDVAAFETLVRKYQDRMLRVLYLLLGDVDDAQDVAQETFIRVFRGIHTFRCNSSFATWIHRIALNTARNWIRDNKQDVLPLQDERRVSGFGRPDDLLMAKERSLELKSALAELPRHYREAIVLRHFEELSYEEIAAVQEVPLGTVRSRLAKARALLQRYLTEEHVSTNEGMMVSYELQKGETTDPVRSRWRTK